MTTEVIITDEFRDWYSGLTEGTQESIRPVVRLLSQAGTALGMPYSSAVYGSIIALRELRVQHAGEPFCILYVFDPIRRAVLLLGGSKTGKGNRWYEKAIRDAERLYAEYLREIGEQP